jgi:hypothetical protein
MTSNDIRIGPGFPCQAFSPDPFPCMRGRIGPLSFASGMAHSLFWVNALTCRVRETTA